jgi:hypothetical protein
MFLIPKCVRIASVVFCAIYALASISIAQESQDPIQLYSQIKSFSLTGGKAEVSNLLLKRDRGEMTFTGTFYFPAPVAGRITGAVFIGQGVFRAAVPPGEFERDNVRRLLKADVVESDFKTAILRFSDDSFDVIGKNRIDAPVAAEAARMATDFNERVLKETGANIPARVALSIINNESPGVFFATFDGGSLDRFSYVFDWQARIPTMNFDINGGERGLIFKYRLLTHSNDILMAFYSLSDYERKLVQYSDINDLVDISNYKLDVDLRSPRSSLGLRGIISMKILSDGVQAIPFLLGEGLGESENQRLKKQMHVKSLRVNGTEISWEQEDWEGGFIAFLPKKMSAGASFDLEFQMEGDFLTQPEVGNGTGSLSYPRSTESWYPRHGYLDRASFDLTFFHSKDLKVASVGKRVSELADPENKDFTITKYRMDKPVALVTFALGSFKRAVDTVKWESGDPPIPLEFNSTTALNIKEDFILAELNNSVRYFHSLFGKYPYETFSATFHPYAFGQGFPTMLMIPNTDNESKYTYSFISHETAHQWWGNIVAWRSYRDQWLSEGFAEYSGVLYTQFRQNRAAARHLIEEMRASLRRSPETLTGLGKGKLNDIGPLILGHRLSSTKSVGGYQTLVYNKGALVLRMIHFLMTDPATGNGQPFFDMMKDFVERYRDKTASTDDFRKVANEHYAKTPLAKKYGIANLDWFFQEWVYATNFPSYTLEYSVEPQPDGSTMLTGNVIQENVPEGFFMPLPVRIRFSGDKVADGSLPALGTKTPFKIKLATAPSKVELDPDLWVLSEKTETK